MNNENLVNEIRSKTDIVDIIGERLPLVSKGKNFFGVCPFHDDTNPSMSVSRDKQIYKCFSCGASGNVFNFLMNYEKMEFPEVIKYLGDRCGVNTSNISVKRTTTKYDNLYEAYRFSNLYFQNNLISSSGRDARNYLKKRGLSEEVIKEFQIGLSLNSRDDLTKLLLSKKYDLSTLNRIGLSSDDHDIYNDRIMFPLYDTGGKVVGFSGRIYKDVDQNKYLNTKETEIFKKGNLLYHYHLAKEEARISKSIIIMEGFMDVIRASTIGVRNTIALMGTALTEEQIKLIKRLSNNVILCLDGDGPGQAATLKIGKYLLDSGVEAKVIELSNDDDPDTFILKNGKDKFLRMIDSAINFSDYNIKSLKKNVNLASDEEKSKYINEVLKETAKINDEIRIEIILKRLAKEFDIGYNTLEKRFREYKLSKPKQDVIFTKKVSPVRKNKYDKAVEELIYLMLNNDWVVEIIEKEGMVYPKDVERILISEIVYFYKKNGYINEADFYTYLNGKTELEEFMKSISNSYRDTVTKEELFLLIKVIKDYSKNQEIKRLTKKLEEENDILEKVKIAEEIRALRIGE